MRRAGGSLLGGAVGAYELATSPYVTNLLGVGGFVLAGAVLATCVLLALLFFLLDVRGYRFVRP